MKHLICSLFFLSILLGCGASQQRMTTMKDGSYFLTFPGGKYESVDPKAPKGLHLKLDVKNGQLHTNPSLEGHGDLANAGTPGWFEIGAGKFFPMQTAKSPTSPYLEGYLTDKGFVPNSKRVL